MLEMRRATEQRGRFEAKRLCHERDTAGQGKGEALLSGHCELGQIAHRVFVTRSERLHLCFREPVDAELLMIVIPTANSESRTRG